jgi:hypothetical protein
VGGIDPLEVSRDASPVRESQQHDHKSFCFCFAVTVSSYVQCFIYFFLTETFSEIVASDRLFLLFRIFFFVALKSICFVQKELKGS